MAKLLPSVRNIDVKQCRWNVTGDVFPVEYAQDQPKAHYATAYLKNGEPMLKASELARRRAGEALHQALRHDHAAPGRILARAQQQHRRVDQGGRMAEGPRHRADLRPRRRRHSPDGFQSSEVAAWDLDMRAALYEGAVINLGVLNGPMSLCAFLDCRYLIFNIVVETAVRARPRSSRPMDSSRAMALGAMADWSGSPTQPKTSSPS
jgi:hypothetical protein